ncbi:hypothetical protein Baya_11094 [Bagarius yarrelli]|uniref:Uncharacterized protein n=1 Tax=Bagarius yarrelli TaxID=175774 RepID=A0A556UZT8_BAGYA|nr:hypothetical protein Baya_11094 [Bagarius yarrelli]
MLVIAAPCSEVPALRLHVGLPPYLYSTSVEEEEEEEEEKRKSTGAVTCYPGSQWTPGAEEEFNQDEDNLHTLGHTLKGETHHFPPTSIFGNGGQEPKKPPFKV